MKRSRSEEFHFPLSFSQPALMKKAAAEKVLDQLFRYISLLVSLVALWVKCSARSSPHFLGF